MYLCYIDESGNTGANLADREQRYLVLVALLATPQSIKSVENDLRDLSYKYFGAESRNTDFELHGYDLYSGKKNRYFNKVSLAKRIAILDEIVEVALKHDALKIGYVCMDKVEYYGKKHIQQMAFHLLLEKIEERLSGHLDSYCLLIADEQDEIEQKLIDDLEHFKQHGTNFGYKSIQIDRIIDSVHFVQSHNNWMMQLTDVLCYLIRRGKEADKNLMESYKAFRESNPDINYIDWMSNNGHRGDKYFSNTYRRINSKKPWLFCKDFPR